MLLLPTTRSSGRFSIRKHSPHSTYFSLIHILVYDGLLSSSSFLTCTRSVWLHGVTPYASYDAWYSNTGPSHPLWMSTRAGVASWANTWRAWRRVHSSWSLTRAELHLSGVLHHERSKHVERREYKMRELRADGVVTLVHTPTDEMDADMLTKPLGDAMFAKHRRSVMNLL